MVNVQKDVFWKAGIITFVVFLLGVSLGYFMEKKKQSSNNKPAGRKFSILGIVFAVLSLIVLPIVFGPLAVIFGIICVVKNDTVWGIVAIVLGGVMAVISTLIALILLS